DHPFYERAKFIWRTPEPDDWAEVYDREVGDSSWRALLRPGENLFGGVKDERNPQVGVGALLLYVWRDLGARLQREGLADAYDWVVITRSDFLWPVPHPDVRHLSDRRVHLLDGEQYLGVSDRHFIVPRRLVGRFFGVPVAVLPGAGGLASRPRPRGRRAALAFLDRGRFFRGGFRGARLGPGPGLPAVCAVPHPPRGRDDLVERGELDERF